MSGVNNKTLNNPINKIKKNFNVFKWSADISGIDENISKQDKLIREAQNVINCATNKRNQFRKDKEQLLYDGLFLFLTYLLIYY
jgi:hypothetical protein